jgi:hypothetical protein
MHTVTQKSDPVQQVLMDRPYCPWRLVPLAACLCVKEYSDAARDRVIDFMHEGGFVEGLRYAGLIDPEDLDDVRAAVEEGRSKWWQRHRRVGTIVVPSISGGAPAGPTVDDVAEMRRATDLDETRDEERRLADSRSPLYGYE